MGTSPLCLSLDTQFQLSYSRRRYSTAEYLFEMIFALILLLQLVQYNVEGKHFLVETDNSMEEDGPGQEQDPVDLQESEGQDYNHLGGLDQLDQLKKELRRQEQQGGNTPKPPKLSVLG